MQPVITTLLWFRKGLRLHDNPALLAACQATPTLPQPPLIRPLSDTSRSNPTVQMCPIFVLDPWFLAPDPSAPSPGSTRVGINRIRFLLESLADLNAQLEARGSRLLILQGDPTIVIPQVMKQWNIQRLCFELDTEPYAQSRDAKVKSAAMSAGVEVISPISHTIFNTANIITQNAGRPPLTYQSFCKLKGEPGSSVGPAPDALPPLPPSLGARLGSNAAAPSVSDAEEVAVSGVPSLADLGYGSCEHEAVSPFKGGETEGLRRLDSCLSNTKWVADFEKPKGDPSSLSPPATTVLSPYLKFGCVSARLMYERVQQALVKHPKHTQPPVSLLGQLLWREFFYTAALGSTHFDRMEGSSVCRQIPWSRDDALLAAWRDSKTGYPWIDAIMEQLRQWGWMHHLARHCVACFLTRGDLFVHWELGRDVFDRMLIDSDWAINNGNWLWLSASAFFHQYHRIYSPITFGKKYDPSGKFICHFLPVLKDMPSQYIYEPWTAPLSVQQKAKCIIGKDYPKPIVDHAVANKLCRGRMGKAYAASKGGQPNEVSNDETDEKKKKTTSPAPKNSKRGGQGSSGSGSGKAKKMKQTTLS